MYCINFAYDYTYYDIYPSDTYQTFQKLAYRISNYKADGPPGCTDKRLHADAPTMFQELNSAYSVFVFIGAAMHWQNGRTVLKSQKRSQTHPIVAGV